MEVKGIEKSRREAERSKSEMIQTRRKKVTTFCKSRFCVTIIFPCSTQSLITRINECTLLVFVSISMH